MSCSQCPHCQQLGGGKEGLSLSLSNTENGSTEKETPFPPVRGKAREYSQAFDIAWKAYPRREQKLEAFGVWLVRAKESGGEAQLLTLVLGSLRWQVPAWMKEGPKFAPYFERYLKRRKWEDEPLPSQAPQAPDPRCQFHRFPNTRGKMARVLTSSCPECKHAAAMNRDRSSEPTPTAALVLPTAEQLAELRKANGRG